MADPDWTLFFTRPISLVFLILAVLSILYTIWQTYRTNYRLKKSMGE